ncbi:MAG: serine hydrolase [Nostoc sp. DedSLP03]|uniref:serine hydrolase n=1 Tax=Nostoc sp. DedSLP03 TaxID=3075400 RepID=UPI002AD2A7FB|nr:serine hydrolase [Nostoc sp. DedSLP03]MDZ7969997.1 serine hydrolase [Nostoc sp. DedSLP03]
MTIAQQVLVDLLGQTFPEIMHELVLEPLGMTNSTYQQPLPNDWLTLSATAHLGSGIPVEGKHHIYPEMAAAGLWTTPSDLAKMASPRPLAAPVTIAILFANSVTGLSPRANASKLLLLAANHKNQRKSQYFSFDLFFKP